MKNLICIIIIFIFCKSSFCIVKSPDISTEEDTKTICAIATFDNQEFVSMEYVQLHPGNTELDKFIEFLAKITHWNLIAGESTKNTKICVSKPETLSVCQTWQIFIRFLEGNDFKIICNSNKYTVEQVNPTDALQILPLLPNP